MSKLEEFSKILPIADIYNDLLKPSTSEIGKGLESVAKTARFLLAPFEYLGNLHDKYLNFLKRVSENVSDKELVEVHPKITGTVFDGIRYLEEESLLFKMFVELLSNAITKNNSSKAHPAFAQIINQLSPDEAIMLLHFKKMQYELWEQMDYNRSTNRFYNNRIIRNDFPVNKLAFPDNYTMYINHLNNLQIAGVPEYRNQEQIYGNGIQVGIKIFRKTEFLDFGKLFSECCIPDAFDENII